MSLKPNERFESMDEFQSALENPDFRLDEEERESITSKPTGTMAEKTRIAGLPVQATLRESALKMKKSKGLILVLGGIGGAVCLFTTALLLFLLPNSPLYTLNGEIITKTGLREPTPTFTTAAIMAEPITETVVQFIPTNTPEPEPALTPTLTRHPHRNLLVRLGLLPLPQIGERAIKTNRSGHRMAPRSLMWRLAVEIMGWIFG